MKTVEKCYTRTSLYSTEQFEVVLCEWSENDTSPLHEHRWSQCHSLVQEGLFENKVISGFKTFTQVYESGQVMTVSAGAEHEMTCLSKKGKTLHVYTPRISEKELPTHFNQTSFQKIKVEVDLNLNEQATSWNDLNQILNHIQSQSISTQSVYFMNQLFAGVLPETLASENLLAKTRTTLATYEASPAFTLIEMEVIQKLGEVIGWKPELIDGVCVPGGSAANFMAVHCARQKKFPDYKTKGIYNSLPLKVFSSQDSHYSIKKACMALGLGTDSLILVETDTQGRMSPEDLKNKIQICIQQNEIPLMVCATAGTTVYGAFDPLEEISRLCQQHNIWMHVDGAWGGPALFSKEIRSHVKGIEKADSMTFDAHKLFGANLTCSFLLTQHPQILLQANDVSGGDYLFHNNSEVIDRGRLSWQCGRQPDATNFWTIWKSYGTQGLGQFVDRLLEVQRESIAWAKTQERLVVISEPSYLNLCIQVLPPAHTPNADAKTWSRHVREQLKEKNLAMVNYSETKEGVLFLRLILAHHQINFAAVKQILNWALAVE